MLPFLRRWREGSFGALRSLHSVRVERASFEGQIASINYKNKIYSDNNLAINFPPDKVVLFNMVRTMLEPPSYCNPCQEICQKQQLDQL